MMRHPTVTDLYGRRISFITVELMTQTDQLITRLESMCAIDDASTQDFGQRVQSLVVKLQETYNLVVLDNLETLINVDGSKTRSLLKALLDCKTLALVITLRGDGYPVTSIRWHPPGVLDKLDDESAKQLVLEISGLPEPSPEENDHSHSEAMAFTYFLTHLNGHPLGLELLGHRLSREGSFLKARKRYERQHTKYLRIGNEKKGSVPNAPSSSEGRYFDLMTCFDLSYDTLSEDARRLFHLLSAIPYGIEQDQAVALLADADGWDAIDNLVSTGLAQYDYQPSYPRNK